jgi:ubiquinone/menaquinone biosynthesis C-methylase UbiE
MESMSFDSIAPVYDATRVFDEKCFNAAIDYIVNRFPPERFPRLFEPGIGTGRIAIPLAERGYKVTGADISGEMLKILAEKLAARATPLPVAYVQRDITSLPFPDASFDIAIAVHIFHLVRDWKKAFTETLRVLKKDAPLVLILTGSGIEIPEVISRYAAICAEYGYPAQHLGMRTDILPGYVPTIHRRLETISGLWMWKQPVRVETFLSQIKAKYYSNAKHVPDDVHLKAVEKLETELKQQYGRLDVEIEVPTEIRVILVLPA